MKDIVELQKISNLMRDYLYVLAEKPDLGSDQDREAIKSAGNAIASQQKALAECYVTIKNYEELMEKTKKFLNGENVKT